ncbi:putative ubiquitin-conjugating enzyme E2 38 [Tasmannia lanceolata]|uniref:putative ubiquitin-conjugating enzyme E2 38 n=1 Tax=Tasmannia lanceolata TaxID=3420 RepID=UPI004063A7D7
MDRLPKSISSKWLLCLFSKRSSRKDQKVVKAVPQAPETVTSSSTVPSSTEQVEGKEENSLDAIYRDINRFDNVVAADYSDHHYINESNNSGQPPKSWTKKIQQEWKILQKGLPDSIFVRVYEERLDLMRAAIVGADETPYHDNLFFFDIFFPSNYPTSPPNVYFHSGGLRLNPNLYQDGKVCLSLLNTWNGSGSEMWRSKGKSSILQVLVSIQGLVLNSKPYFNEPGFEKSEGTPEGERRSIKYNENAFLLSCRTMVYMLERPPKNFEKIVSVHFQLRGIGILEACKAYLNGGQAGSLSVGDEGCSSEFKASLQLLVPKLCTAFTQIGLDCGQAYPVEEKAQMHDQL